MEAPSNPTSVFTPKSNSFSISSILADKKSKSRNALSQIKKNSEPIKVVVGRQGVGHYMSPGSLFGPIRVTLENKGLWDIFHDAGTEMVITKSGRFVISNQLSDF